MLYHQHVGGCTSPPALLLFFYCFLKLSLRIPSFCVLTHLYIYISFLVNLFRASELGFFLLLKDVFPPRSSKCRHFCFSFDLHNYCPTCRESGKGDDLCVTNQAPCNICQDLSAEQHAKIKNRRRYTRKQKSDVNTCTSKDDLDLLGEDEESFTGSQADLEGAAENFSSPPHPQPLRFEALSIKTPHNVPTTPGTSKRWVCSRLLCLMP